MLTSCTYGNNKSTISGNCGYQATGVIDRNSSTGEFWNGQQNFFYGYASSSIDATGGLHALAHAEFGGYPVDTFNCCDSASATAVATVDDILTFSTSGNAQPIQVIFNIQVDGSFTTQGLKESSAKARFNYLVGGPGVAPDNFLSSGVQTFQTQAVSPDANGQLQYFFQLAAFANISCIDTAFGGGVHLCSPSSTASFENTAKVTSIIVQDLLGNTLSGYTVTSQGGVDYSSAVAGSTPEPGSLLLGVTGLAFVFLRRRT